LYASPNIIRAIKSQSMKDTEETRNVYEILVGKPERKIPFGRSRCVYIYIYEDNIRMCLRKIS